MGSASRHYRFPVLGRSGGEFFLLSTNGLKCGGGRFFSVLRGTDGRPPFESETKRFSIVSWDGLGDDPKVLPSRDVEALDGSAQISQLAACRTRRLRSSARSW